MPASVSVQIDPTLTPAELAGALVGAAPEIRDAFVAPKNTMFLHAKQMEVFKSNRRFKVVVAGRRWGKSQLAKISLIKYARKPKRLIWYVAPSYRMAKQIMWPELVEAIPRAWVKKYNETILTITLVNGSKIELKGADNPDCFDEQTEILTPDGWVFLKNLPEDLAVMTLNRETNSAEWQVPTRHIHQQYDGPMFKLESGKLDMLVTPGHRFLVDTRKGARKFKTLDDIAHQDRIPASVEWAGEDDDFWTHDMVAFMGFYIAEGCARKDPGPKKSYEVTFAQTPGIKGGSKGDVRANFIEVLKRLGASFGEGEDSIRVYGKKWWELTHRLGLAWEKRIPQEILDLPPEKLRTLLHWMIAGDGTDRNGERVYYTTSYGLAGDVQEVCMKIGQSAAVSLKHETGNEACLKDGRTITARRDLYQVAIYRNKFIHFRDSKESYIKTVEDFSGIVHCVEVPNQTIYVRRNGKATWSGNSLRGVGIHYLVMDEVQDIDPEAWKKVLRPTLASTQGHALFIGCVRGSTRILTRKGAHRIDSLARPDRKAGELDEIDLDVYGVNREFHRADGFYNNGSVPTRKVQTHAGFEIEASEPHPLMVMSAVGVPVWKRTDQIEVGDRIAIGKGMEQWGNANPLDGLKAHMCKWSKQFEGKRGPKPTPLEV